MCNGRDLVMTCRARSSCFSTTAALLVLLFSGSLADVGREDDDDGVSFADLLFSTALIVSVVSAPSNDAR